MYIFKNPDSDEVTSHVDSTFLYTTPRTACLGLWLALDTATTENGCVWARPKSHQEPLRKIYKKNATGCMEFHPCTPQDSWPEWEGKLPGNGTKEALHNAGFVPAECARGDLLLIHGSVDHLSLPNNSQLPRHTYQLHLVEGPEAGVTWSEGSSKL